MTGPHPSVAATRLAVRRAVEPLAGTPADADPPVVLVACSGGADSLALAAAVAFEAPRAGLRAAAVVVDHGLQDGSAAVAARAALACGGLGVDPVRVIPVTVVATGAGPEADARTARHTALDACARELGAVAVLLGHTRDDQAEQVLLGLARGSGARSLAAMAPRAGLLVRPLLGLPRSITAQACAAQGLTPWHDPQNNDPRYARVRARDLLGRFEDALGPGVGAALARSAGLLREDADALDAYALAAADTLGEAPWQAVRLAALPIAVQGRLWRLLAVRAGCPAGQLSAVHVRGLVALVTDWHGQRGVCLPGGWCGERSGAHLRIRRDGSG